MDQKVCKLTDCENPTLARGLCRGHYLRWYKWGDNFDTTPIRDAKATERFIESALKAKADSCVLWPFERVSGYGVIQRDNVKHGTHRYVCDLAHGKPPSPRHQAAHSCGKRACINPNHLRWATRSENELDKRDHGRDNRGQNHPLAKLTDDEARAIFALRGSGKSQREVATSFGVIRQTVSDIWREKRRAHLHN